MRFAIGVTARICVILSQPEPALKGGDDSSLCEESRRSMFCETPVLFWRMARAETEPNRVRIHGLRRAIVR